MREREGYDGRPLRAPPLSPARQRRSGLPPACPSPFRPPSPPGPALLFPSEVAAVSLLCSSVLPLLPTSLSPRPEAGLSSCPASSGWSYHSWPLASGAFSFLWAAVRACPAMNEEYDVIVLGTGLTVSAEFWAAPAPRRRGGRAGPARGEGIWGPARTPLLPGRVNPGLRLRVSWWTLGSFFRVCLWRGVGKGRRAGCERHVPPRVDRRPQEAKRVVEWGRL